MHISSELALICLKHNCDLCWNSVEGEDGFEWYLWSPRAGPCSCLRCKCFFVLLILFKEILLHFLQYP